MWHVSSPHWARNYTSTSYRAVECASLRKNAPKAVLVRWHSGGANFKGLWTNDLKITHAQSHADVNPKCQTNLASGSHSQTLVREQLQVVISMLYEDEGFWKRGRASLIESLGVWLGAWDRLADERCHC